MVMVKNWDTYTRQGLDLASSAASIGFSVAKTGTKLSFAVTREIASTAIGITTTVVDHAAFGGLAVTKPIGGAVSAAIRLVEQLTLAPIQLGEYITSSSIVAAHNSINVLSAIFPGSHEASFSLASFINLVKREWKEPLDGENLPEKQYGIASIARAIVAWVALQGVTQEWQERQWLEHLREIDVKDAPKSFDSRRSREDSRIRLTSDVIYPGNLGQLLVADIGAAPECTQAHNGRKFICVPESKNFTYKLSNAELKVELRRFCKLVLMGYGGASLLFFGVPLSGGEISSGSPQAKVEEAQLADAVNASEAEAEGPGPRPKDIYEDYSWWEVLIGKHDHEILAKIARNPNSTLKADIKIG